MSDRSLTPELFLGAYASGIFPMAETRDDPEVYWVDPQMRGVLPLHGFHLSRSLARRMKRSQIKATLDVGFEQVIDGCAARDETWINYTIRELMSALFERGYAHAFAVWEDGEMIGGMYGLSTGGVFFGESMFSNARDGSKIALAFAVDHLRRCGFTLFDTQFITPHLTTMGGVEIPRAAYHAKLQRALEQVVHITDVDLETDPQAVVQRMTQMS